MNLVGRRAYLLGPTLYALCAAALFATWLAMAPEALRAAFDQDGFSPFEIATLPFYAAIIPLVWWKCPFTGSRARRTLLCAAVSCVAFMAVVKETDLHLWAMNALYPDIVRDFAGTPFKMRFLTAVATKSGLPIPLGAKALSLAYFALFFGVFGVTLAYFLPALARGFFALNPVAWTMCCFGTSGVMVQICDRLPAWWRHTHNLAKADMTASAFGAFCTAFEEGGEMMIAIFALLAILQSHARIHARRGVG